VKEILENIARAIVEQPDEVRVSERQDGETTVLSLTVAPDDMGRVIGKQGKIARAIRTVIRAAAIRANMRVIVDIVDDERTRAARGAANAQ